MENLPHPFPISFMMCTTYSVINYLNISLPGLGKVHHRFSSFCAFVKVRSFILIQIQLILIEILLKIGLCIGFKMTNVIGRKFILIICQCLVFTSIFVCCLIAAHQVGQVKCGSCSVLLMYPYGAPSVRCSSCRFVTDIGVSISPKICLAFLTWIH